MKPCEIKVKSFKLNGEKDIEIEFSSKNKNDINKNTNIFIKLLTGSIIGFVNGFWGGGGGMLCVPMLQNIIKIPDKKAHATTLLIMLPLSIASIIVYFTFGNIPIYDTVKIGIGFILGGIIGAYLLKIISNSWLGIMFSLIIIISGVKLLI